RQRHSPFVPSTTLFRSFQFIQLAEFLLLSREDVCSDHAVDLGIADQLLARGWLAAGDGALLHGVEEDLHPLLDAASLGDGFLPLDRKSTRLNSSHVKTS